MADVIFENRSLNRHVKAVALAFEVTEASGPAHTLVWRLIRRCPFLWWHPFRVDPALSVRFRSRDGAYSPTLALRPGLRFEGAELVWDPSGPQDRITVTPAGDPRIWALRLFRGGAPVAEARMPWDGALRLTVSRALALAADPGLPEGAPITLGPDAARVDLDGVASLTIGMTGGEPGPRATPIRFVAHQHVPL